jgi:hypothetical protein
VWAALGWEALMDEARGWHPEHLRAVAAVLWAASAARAAADSEHRSSFISSEPLSAAHGGAIAETTAAPAWRAAVVAV